MEAKSNVQKRLEFITTELDRLDTQLKAHENKAEKRQQQVRACACMHACTHGCSCMGAWLHCCAATAGHASDNDKTWLMMGVCAQVMAIQSEVQRMQQAAANPG